MDTNKIGVVVNVGRPEPGIDNNPWIEVWFEENADKNAESVTMSIDALKGLLTSAASTGWAAAFDFVNRTTEIWRGNAVAENEKHAMPEITNYD